MAGSLAVTVGALRLWGSVGRDMPLVEFGRFFLTLVDFAHETELDVQYPECV
jgi:hypothetical protein